MVSPPHAHQISALKARHFLRQTIGQRFGQTLWSQPISRRNSNHTARNFVVDSNNNVFAKQQDVPATASGLMTKDDAAAASDAAQKGLPSSVSPALSFQVVAEQNRARTALLKLPHYTAHTPMFMPVGTQGTVKGLTSEQLQDLDCHVILGNTYHLENRPGAGIVDQMGGLHGFSNWPRGMLTDSGGFQMVSLLHLADITEEGVTFQSPIDGTRMLLTPEHSMNIQNQLGADIMMALDDVVPSTTPDPARVEEATYRTTRWLDRCLKAHKRPTEQSLFAIVQGGLDARLREISLQELIERDTPGYAIGGLAGGEDKDSFWRVVAQCAAALPPGKPRYVMGIGYPLDVVVCSCLGADMYDSVYPTRTARFGVALVPEGTMKLRNAVYKKDFRPLDETCSCMVCKRYTRSYLHHTVARNFPFASHLVSYHNVAYMQNLTRQMRTAIREQRLPEWVRNFFAIQFPKGDVPVWVRNAMEVAGISLDGIAKPLEPGQTDKKEGPTTIGRAGGPKGPDGAPRRRGKQRNSKKRGRDDVEDDKGDD